MQLVLIRHARPQSSELGGGSDPNLSYDGNEQARRLPGALSKFSLARIVSSPQLQATQTAAPVADQLGVTVDIDERFAEHDYQTPGSPSGDQAAFLQRVKAGIDDVIASAERDQTVAVFTHSGVINAVVHRVLRTEQLFCIQPDWASVTRVLVAEDGSLDVGSINVTDHVWDLLYRTQWWSEEH